MSKELDLVKNFIKLAKDEMVSELSFKNSDFEIKLNLAGQTVVTSAPVQQIVTSTVSEYTEEVVTQKSKKSKGAEIKSPFVGTFYTSPAPGKPEYVKVGDKVKKGQTLCILEAMKIMNEIESDADGTVLEICVENESLVEYGETLFIIG